MTHIHIAPKILPGASNPLYTEALRPKKLVKDFCMEMVCPDQDAVGYLRRHRLQCASLPVFLDSCFYKVLNSIDLSGILISGVIFITVCRKGRRKMRWFS